MKRKFKRDYDFKEENKKAESDIIKKIVEVKEELALLKSTISGNNFINFSNEKRKEIRREFKRIYAKYDELNRNEDEISISKIRTTECMFECMEVQALITRITNKIQREEAKLISDKSEEIKKDSEDIKKENTKLKDSIITVSSLVFMSFTFIQLNFVAFQRSSDYGVLDRIILFSGINAFVIVGVYSIILMINMLLSGEIIKKKNKYVEKRLLLVFIFFILVYTFALVIKNIKEENPEIKTLRLSLIEKQEEIKEMNKLISILNIESQNINELKNNYEKQVKNLKEQLSKSEKILKELNGYTSKEYLAEYIENIEEKVISNLKEKKLTSKEKVIKLAKKEENKE